MVAPERCGACDGALRQDPDVLDTWFSSALWPFATLGWPDDTPELRAFYPTDALVTAREIIFLWVARMIMMGLEFTGLAPFRDVYITSVIQAPDGRRMSKSLGTGIDPLEEIDRSGADAVRFGMLAMSSTQDVRYSTEKVAQGQRLANKLFNAARFALLGIDLGVSPQPLPSAIEDRWILARLLRCERSLGERIAAFDFAHAALELYDFVYGELCDWYLELVKSRLNGPDRASLSATLRFVLRETVALAHPLIPFVTEEIWSYLREPHEGLLAGERRTPLAESLADPEAEAALERAQAATVAVRGWREGAGVTPGAPLRARIAAEGYQQTAALVARMARLELVGEEEGEPDALAEIAVPGGRIEVLEGVDTEALAQRAAARRRTRLAEIARAQAKLADAAFVAKAPPAVVAREREKLAALRAELEALP